MMRVPTKTKRVRRKTKIGEALRKHAPLLPVLLEARDPVRKRYMSCCSREMCDAMSELADNLLKGNIPLTEAQLELLRPSAKDIETLAKKKTSLKDKRNILQKGGFFGALIGPAIKILGPLVSGLVGAFGGGK